jgi:hypothetical protein
MLHHLSFRVFTLLEAESTKHQPHRSLEQNSERERERAAAAAAAAYQFCGSAILCSRK